MLPPELRVSATSAVYWGSGSGESCCTCHWRDFGLCAVSGEESTSFGDGQPVASPWLFVRPFVLKDDSKAVSELRLGPLPLPWQLERTLAVSSFFLQFSAFHFHLCCLLTTNLPLHFNKPVGSVLGLALNKTSVFWKQYFWFAHRSP